MMNEENSNRSADFGKHAALRSRLEAYNQQLSQLEAKVAVAQAAADRANAALERCVADRDEVF